MNAFDYFFEKSARLNKKFVLGSKEEIDYRELHRNSLKLARYIDTNFPVDEKIIIISPNNVFFITAYLAILKSGRVCVPLNPDIEKNNLDYIISECQCQYAFISEKLKVRFNPEHLEINTEEILDKIQTIPLESEIDKDFPSDNCAEIIFTSGSTGIPKGVMLSHKNLIANTNSIVQYLKLTANDVIEIVLPFYYCYGLSLLHTHLRVGGSVVLNNTFIFLGSVLNDLKKFKCTGFAGVPSHFQILLRKSASFKTSSFPDLRYVTQAGGKLHDVFIQEFMEYQPDIEFFVMYGQTEATARLSYLPVEILSDKIGSIGKGIPGVRLKVVDANGSVVKPGQLGEITASGDNIMLGYLNDAKANESAIRNGWLYTGDLATVDEDGYIFLKARSKEIIKVGGKRVSPKEIEEVIVSIPEVIDCTVSATDDELQGEAIKAVVVIDKINQNRITEKYIQEQCARHLATFKVPKIIERVDRIQVASTGKKVLAQSV